MSIRILEYAGSSVPTNYAASDIATTQVGSGPKHYLQVPAFNDGTAIKEVTKDNPLPVGGGALGSVKSETVIDAALDADAIALLKGILFSTRESRMFRRHTRFTRPANTNAYANTYLLANDTVAANVVPVEFDIGGPVTGRGRIYKLMLEKSGKDLANAQFRVHFYNGKPTVNTASGDGKPWLTNERLFYLGSMDVTCDRVFDNGALGIAISSRGAAVEYEAASGTTKLWALIETLGPYAGVSGESFGLMITGERA